MILVSNFKISPNFDFKNSLSLCAKELNIKEKDIKNIMLHRKSIDARKKSDVHFICSFILELNIDENKIIEKNKNVSLYSPKEFTLDDITIETTERPIIVGFGPAGLFAALTLSRMGLKPIVLERGNDVDKRTLDVENFNKHGILSPNSNIQFGEGGAGTFSDGKLTTGIKDPRCSYVLKTLVEFGAKESILYDSKPHIGTDVLKIIVKNIRNEIIHLGGEVRFGAKLTDFKLSKNEICEVVYQSGNESHSLPCKNLILATGHSARDIFFLLKEKGVYMERKAFSVGARIEHSQRDIDISQLGAFAEYDALTPMDYKLSCHLENGRGVYTFCMCPGGEVVNGASEDGGIVTNGMSNSLRNGENANSALLVSVTPEDFSGDDVLAGVEFQREIERKAFAISNSYALPIQKVGDFLNHKPSKKCGKIKPSTKSNYFYGTIDDCLPSFVTNSMREAIKIFDRKIKGFANPEALLIAPETRSSSPVRIKRDEDLLSSVNGIFPCGEGAGYAGGIMSAAVDGIKCAQALTKRMCN